jgi:hypothetical protein
MHLTTRPWISYEALLRLLNQYDTHKHIYLVQNTMVSAIKRAIESNVILSDIERHHCRTIYSQE